MNSIKKYRLLILFLLLVCGQSAFGQEAPEPPIITRVNREPSINKPGAVKIEWKPSPTPNVDGYILYRYIKNDQLNGYIIINQDISATDTVYIDPDAQANIKSESYYLEAYFGNREIIGLHCPPHATLFLSQVKYDSCSMTNTLTWNPYIGWGNEVYYTLVDENGNAIPDAADLKDTVFIHAIEPGNTYSYSIIAVQEADSNVNSSSNQQSVYTTPIKQPDSTKFYINRIDYSNSTASFTVNTDITADLSGHSLLVSRNENSGFSEAVYKETEGSENIKFSHTAENQPLFYKVAAIMVCNDTVLETNVVQPIVLHATATETEVNLKWNESYIQSTSEIYKIYLSVDVSDYKELEQPNERRKTYQFDQLGTETSELFCFRIEAENNETHTSFSNEACVSRLPIIKLPNAFTPNADGINDYFGSFWKEGDSSSYIKKVQVKEFEIIIYDKYGSAVFVDDDPGRVWDGAVKGKYVPEGGYVYYMRFKTALGKSYEKSGTINVVYP